MRKILLLIFILLLANFSYASPTDWDEDGILNAVDNCPYTSNPTQIDSDADGIGDTCDCDPLVANPGGYQGIIFVNYAAAGLNNGKSWANAFTSLESALVEARLCPNVQIWVAKGTYKPSAYPQNITGSPTLTSRDYTFHLVDGVKMYGGFNGTESSINERVLGNETILSGDLSGNDNPSNGSTYSENCHNVVLSINDSGNTILDGFTISKGGYWRITSTFISEGETIDRQKTAGISNIKSGTKYSNNNLVGNFLGNINIESSAKIVNCYFGFNVSGISNIGLPSVQIINSICYNSGDYGIPAIANENSSPLILNCTLLYNVPFDYNCCGSAIVNNNNSNPIIKNTIIWDAWGPFGIANNTGSSPLVSYSIISGATIYPGIGNSNSNPLFTNPGSPASVGLDGIWRTADDGLQLQATSSAINASDPSTVLPINDATGFDRIGIFDIGAYEVNPCLSLTAGRAYVMQSATGANNGSNWSDAFTDFQSALEATRNCGVTEIWVAQGTYLPSKDVSDLVPAFDRNKTFFINKDVKIFGGFIGGETALSARLPDTYITTLSGDIGVADVNNDNAIHVITIDGVPATSTLDAFTITKGNSDNLTGTSSFDGAGVFLKESNILIEDCKFTSNLADTGGGAIAIWATAGTTISPKISNCYFSQNIAMGDGDATLFPSATNAGGGAIRLYSQGTSSICSPVIDKCIFDNNYTIHGHGGAINSTGSYNVPIITNTVFTQNQAGVSSTYLTNGGAIFNQSQKASISNSVFEGNLAAGGGGGIYNLNDDPKILNSTFFNNKADTGGAIENTNSNPKITNCIIWENSTSIQNQSITYQNTTAKKAASTPDITYTDIKGGYTGVGNINEDPLFTDATNPAGADGIWMTADDGLSIKTTSPAINTGINTPVTLPRDLAEATRIQNSIVDMGAYETLVIDTTLPINLISFTAQPQENQVLLTWQTSSESNSVGFEIERSENAREFTTIGFVKSEANNGNSNEKLGYQFLDETPMKDNNFYRLKQLDLNGKFEYSTIKLIKIKGDQAINIYPNPTNGLINIETFGQRINSLELFNAKGSKVYYLNKFNDNIDISNQPKGIYFLKIKNIDNKIILKKIVKN